jgi:hypothetical protein
MSHLASDVTDQLVALTWRPNAYGTASKTGIATTTSTNLPLTLSGGSGITINAGQVQPPAAGYLLLSAALSWSAAPTAGRCWAEWAIPGKSEYVRNGFQTGENRGSVHALINVDATDYVQLNVYHANSGVLNIDCRWRAVLIGQIGGKP